MHSDAVLNLFLSFVLLFMGLMFLGGLFHRANVNPDDIFFSAIKDRRIFKAADQVAFDTCVAMMLFALLNAFALHTYSLVPSVRAFFVVIGIILSWLIRLIFIAIYRNKNYNQVPRIWPFSRIK